MHDYEIHRRHQQPSHAVAQPATRQRRRGETRRQHRPSGARSGRWVLVQVYDGTVLAAFDDEAGALEAMSCADDDEVVVLHVKK